MLIVIHHIEMCCVVQQYSTRKLYLFILRLMLRFVVSISYFVQEEIGEVKCTRSTVC